MTRTAMRVIVTRPEPECSRWVEAMQAEGLSAVALPLIDIVSTPFELDAAKHHDAFVFVSRSSVDSFFQSKKIDALQTKWVLASGPGTAASLVQHGLQADLIDMPDADASQFDSEALWAVSSHRDWLGKHVLVVRGANLAGEQEGRPWLADQLAAAGASVDFVASYQRGLPNLTDAQREILKNPQTDDVWVFSSSQSIAHLKLLMPSANWSEAKAITTHDRIFISALAAGFGADKVQLCRPVLAEVIATLKRI